MHPLSVGLHATPAVLPHRVGARWPAPLCVALVLPLSWLSVEVATFGGRVALWWPAAGLAVLAVAVTSAGRRPVVAMGVAVTAGLGNALGGRATEVALTLGLANGLEAFVGGTVLAYGVRGWPQLRTLPDLARLCGAAVAAAASVSVLVASIAAYAYDEPWLPLASGVFASHLAAVLVVTPLGLGVSSKGQQANRFETAVQTALLFTTAGAVFSPQQQLPMAFLMFPSLAWGALRLAPRLVTWQLAALSVLVTGATIAGWGEFATHSFVGADMEGALLQLLLVTMAGVALPLTVVRSQSSWTEDALESSDDMLDSIMSATTATGVLGASLDGAIEFFNVGAEEMTGWTADEVVGSSCLVVTRGPHGRYALTVGVGESPDRDRLRSLVQPFQADRSQQSFSHDWDFVRKDGTVRTLAIRISKRHRDGEVIGYLGVAHDVTERRRQQELTAAALEAERRMVEQLEQVDRVKNDFMATVSHELRTPITSILGYTELLMSDETGALPTMHRQILSRVERNGRRLIGLVEDVLTMSQIEAGELRFRFRDVDLRTVLERAVETEISVFGVAGVLLEQDVAEEPLLTTGDAEKLERAFAALLDNAAKYSNTGSTTRVSLHPDGEGNAVLVVRDEGTGIATEDQGRIFERFWRSKEANDRAIQGAGLGLTVAHSIVGGHHGTITCESERGDGTTITVTLPLVDTSEEETP